jgi:hypothetical protein
VRVGCACCDHAVEWPEPSISVGRFVAETGMRPNFTWDGDVLWVCGACAPRVVAAAAALADVLGGPEAARYVHLGMLITMGEET